MLCTLGVNPTVGSNRPSRIVYYILLAGKRLLSCGGRLESAVGADGALGRSLSEQWSMASSMLGVRSEALSHVACCVVRAEWGGIGGIDVAELGVRKHIVDIYVTGFSQVGVG